MCILPLSKQARMEREGTRKEARKEKRRKREGQERKREAETVRHTERMPNIELNYTFLMEF